MAKKQAVDRFERQRLAEQQKILKPGECNKTIIDPSCLNLDVFGTEICNTLSSAGFQFSLEDQSDRIITWRRSLPRTISTTNVLTAKYSVESHLLFLMPGMDLVNHVKSGTLLAKIETLQQSSFTVHLLICGLKTHCKANRGCVSRTQTEFILTRAQLLLNCSHRLLETAEELATTISQFTKSIAEDPFKQQKMKKMETETFYLGNDSKDCVKILQNGIGLSRLWQQSLTKLPMVTLEVAEAITAQYPMPKLLIEALEMADEPEKLLENLQIRRSGLSATANRRIGPELSHKISNLFLNLDPNAVI